MNIIFFLFFLSLNILSYAQTFHDFIFDNIFFPSNRNPDDLDLVEWLNKLIIDLPNDLIKNETQGYLEDLTIYNISLESLITSNKIIIDNKIGVEITFRNVGLNIKGKHTVLTQDPKNVLLKISRLSMKLPFFLVKNESGLITEVDTTGFTIDLDHAQIEIDLEDTSDIARNIIVGILKLVLKFIKTNVIEKNLIQLMNKQLEEALATLNQMIINRVQPEELNVTINEMDRADLRRSPIIGSLDLILVNFEGAEGPLSLNSIINLVTNNTGIISLKNFYDKDIQFEFNITDKNNNSLGNFQLSLDDIEVSGLNTWRYFKVLYPSDPLELLANTSLDNLTLSLTFSLRVKLDNTSKIVRNKTILYQKAELKTNIQNNKLIGYFQFPFNNKKSFQYTNKECLNISCILDLIDSNGTGISSISLNETFTYITLEAKEGGYLEEDLDDTISRLTDLFITGFDNNIAILINALVNTTLINLVNKKINEYLYSAKCTELKDEEFSEINIVKASTSVGVCVGIFLILIFSPYILRKAFKKKKEERIIRENDINREASISSSDYIEKDTEARYCIESISIKWMKEFFRIDPEGASLFLDPRIHLFFRIFIPLAILLTIALFISSNTGRGAIVFLMFLVGRRVQVPSSIDLGINNTIHDLWAAGSYGMSLLVAVFSLIWPYIKLVLMLISFCLPASILSHKNREKILLILDATGKFSIIHIYIIILILLAIHFLIEIPVAVQSLAKEGTTINIAVYQAYGYFSLIIGTFISLVLSHIITHLNRRLYSHPDENKGEKAESHRSIMSFAKTKYIDDKRFRIIISFLLLLTLGLTVSGSVIWCFAFSYSGLVGNALDIFQIPILRELTAFVIGLVLPEAYENPNGFQVIYTQIAYFLPVLIVPYTFLLIVCILWFVPMSRKAQKTLYSIAEILNAWSCIDVFAITLLASLTEIKQYAKYVVDDKFKTIDSLIRKYFSKMLGDDYAFFLVKTVYREGFWLFLLAALFFPITSFVILKLCRNALNERLPDHVKEYLKMKKEERISHVSNINDFSSRTTLINKPLNNNNNNDINNKNLLAVE